MREVVFVLPLIIVLIGILRTLNLPLLASPRDFSQRNPPMLEPSTPIKSATTAPFKPLRAWFFARIARLIETDVLFNELESRGKIDSVIDEALAECGPEEVIACRDAFAMALHELRMGHLGEVALWLERAIPDLSAGAGLTQLIRRNAK